MATFQDFLDRGLNLQATRADIVAGLNLQTDPVPPTGAALLTQIRDVIGAGDLRGAATSVLWNPILIATNPLDLATSLINAKYNQLGSAGGILGTSTSAVTVLPDGVGFQRQFRFGAIYWHPFAGAHEVHGPIRDKWIALGAERGLCSYPTTDVSAGHSPSMAGSFQHFQGASLYSHGVFLDGLIVDGSLLTTAALATAMPLAPVTPAADRVSATLASSSLAARSITTSVTTASSPATDIFPNILTTIPILPNLRPRGFVCEVHGAIRDKYLALGAESSILGYPTTDETGTPDGVGRFNHFQGGSIYWTPSTGAYEVHGLIRNLWASQGWERNPALGYPIADEMIPDRRIGKVRPESARKPIASIPVDVIKFPAAAAGIAPATVVNTVPILAATSISRASFVSTPPLRGVNIRATSVSVEETSVLGPLRAVSPGIVAIRNPDLGLLLVEQPASAPAPTRSANRFSDFENGVLFWQRGANAAKALTPWIQNSTGQPMHRSVADVVAAVDPFLRSHLANAGGPVSGISFSGTTGYVYDGAGPQNRRHRILAMLIIPSGNIFQPLATVGVEFQFVTVFEPRLRKVVVLLIDWNIVLSSGSTNVAERLHTVFDPLLWTGIDLIVIADTDAGNPVALLSAKTMGTGEVCLFVEPADQKVN